MAETILYSIFYFIFCGALLFCVGACISYPLIWAYCTYCLSKSKNKIEWKCEETEINYDKRVTSKNDSEYKEQIEFEIAYRVKPSELNWFVRIFGNNDWDYPYPHSFYFFEEFAEEGFKKIIKDYETLGDVRKLERKEGRIKLYR